jgi:hypothetical protein
MNRSALPFFGATRCRVASAVLFILGALAAMNANAQCVTNTSNPGCVHFELRTGSSFDTYTNNMTSSEASWFLSHLWEMQTTSPYFNSYLSLYPRAIAYFDLFAIPVGSSVASEHPDWIMKDSSGNQLYISFACNGTSCSQWAGDFANADFRSYQISQISSILSAGYVGIWLDDVDLQMESSNGTGTIVSPIDSTTGSVMSTTAWEQHISAFTTQIRQAFPSTQLTHNSIWYAGTRPAGSDPYVQAEIQAADYINLERGVGDPNLVAGSSEWGLNAMLAFVDVVHSLGKKVVVQEYNLDEDYGLAGYYLISTGMDAFGDDGITPSNWWSGYDTSLGTPLAARYTWNGVLRRDYTGGMVLLNAFQGATATLTLPGTYTTTSGSKVSSVTLSGGEAAVLVGTSTTTTPSAMPVSLSSYFNTTAFVNDGSSFSASGGIDTYGNAYSANLLGSTKTFNGITFDLGSATALNGVSNKSVTLPAAEFSTLNVLATGVDGNQASQTFTVTYSDGSTSTFTQGLSDWHNPQSYSGESTVLGMSYRDEYNGTKDSSSTNFNVYGYSFALNSSKSVSSVKLPANSHVVVLAITLH